MINDFNIILDAGLKGLSLKCPKCQQSSIYRSKILLKTHDACPDCGFNIKNADTGDGPAYVAICIAGVLIPVLAVLAEAIYSPSYWLHAAIWVPALFISSWVVLLYSRAIFIALEYKIRELENNDKK